MPPDCRLSAGSSGDGAMPCADCGSLVPSLWQDQRCSAGESAAAAVCRGRSDRTKSASPLLRSAAADGAYRAPRRAREDGTADEARAAPTDRGAAAPEPPSAVCAQKSSALQAGQQQDAAALAQRAFKVERSQSARFAALDSSTDLQSAITSLTCALPRLVAEFSRDQACEWRSSTRPPEIARSRRVDCASAE